jgi:hypothetical protein
VLLIIREKCCLDQDLNPHQVRIFFLVDPELET